MTIVSRTSTSEEIAAKLADSLKWIDLRTKLLTLLQKEQAEGDVRSSAFIDFVVRRWPGGGAPRSAEVIVLERQVAKLQNLVQSTMGALAAFTDPHMALLRAALECGVDLPTVSEELDNSALEKE